MKRRDGRRGAATKDRAVGAKPIPAPEFTIAHIPIYWRSSARHAKYFAGVKDRELQGWSALGEEALAKGRRRLANRDPSGWFPWEYNDVIGWIRVYVDRGIVHFATYLKRGKRGRGRRLYQFIELVNESVYKIYGSQVETPAQAQEEALELVRAVRKEMQSGTVFVDLSDFESLIEHLDWPSLLR